jgi:hypothetical protein
VRIHERLVLLRPSAPGHRVHREVAPGKVLLDRSAELDDVGPAVVRVRRVAPKGGDLVLVGTVADDDGPESILV